ncbi:MAG: hypothetical protein QOK43_2158 [Acidimicrobiaceae bacterium]|nr:hypothetical protein [Acidimicrobiaceae bacterium]
MATATSDRDGSRRNQRGPSVLYGGATACLLLVILLVAMSAPRIAPPAVAEIAPQAVEQIKDAPEEQASTVGTGEGQGGDGLGDDGSGTTGDPKKPSDKPPRVSDDPEALDRSSVLHCVGNPPRQIEDPQSPPCIAIWEGDNGGATSRGVTADEVTVAVGDPAGAGAYPQALLDDFATFFNKRFQFYGRKLRLVSFPTAGQGAKIEEMQRDASRVADEIGAFAAASYGYEEGRESLYFDELARRKVVSVMQVSFGLPSVDEAHMRRNAPYQWNYTPSADILLRDYGTFLCSTLAHKGAAYSGGAELFKLRKFGIIVDTTTKDQLPPVDIRPLQEVLRSCDSEADVVEWSAGEQASAMLVGLRNDGVTSILYTGATPTLSTTIMPAATGQGYQPEWLISNFGHQDDDDAATYFAPDQAQHVLGLQVYSKTLPNEDLPSTWALREANPAEYGGYTNHWIYESLLVLASGIQMAGPRLTPETFQAGLFKTRFPNPGAGAAPYYQATVGFPGVHSFVQDLAPVWLSSSDKSVATARAPSYCYVFQGRRFKAGTFPDALPFRQQPCR